MQCPEAKDFRVWSFGPCRAALPMQKKRYVLSFHTHRRCQLYSGPRGLRRLASVGRGRVRAAAGCHGAVTEAGRRGPVSRAGRRLVGLRAATRPGRRGSRDVGIGTRGGLVPAASSSRRGRRVAILRVVDCNIQKREILKSSRLGQDQSTMFRRDFDSDDHNS